MMDAHKRIIEVEAVRPVSLTCVVLATIVQPLRVLAISSEDELSDQERYDEIEIGRLLAAPSAVGGGATAAGGRGKRQLPLQGPVAT